MATIYLLRHAQSAPCPKTPESDWPLSDLGLKQAKAIAPILSSLEIEKVFSSPYKRCRQTIQHFEHHENPEIHEHLHERIVTDKMITEFREFWVRSWEDFNYALENGESSKDCQVRVTKAILEIATSHTGKNILISCHGAAIGLFLNFIEPSFGREDCERLTNPDLKRVMFENGKFLWDKDFTAHSSFKKVSTPYHQTPLIGVSFPKD